MGSSPVTATIPAVHLSDALAAFFREDAPLARGEGVVVAFSGGPDSTALLWGMSRLAAERGYRLPPPPPHPPPPPPPPPPHLRPAPRPRLRRPRGGSGTARRPDRRSSGRHAARGCLRRRAGGERRGR